MGGSSSDHVVLISALSGWPLIKQGQWVDKDELGVSVAPSPAHSTPGVSLTIKPIFVLTCQWPAPLHPVASKGMVNQAFHVPRHVGLFTALLTPLRLPKGSQLSGANRNSGCTPCCCVIPMPWFFKTSPTLWLAGPHCNKPNWWVKSEHTQNLLTWLCCWFPDLWSSCYEVWKLFWVSSWGNRGKKQSVLY